MAHIVRDSFDFYSSLTDMGTVWSAVNSANSLSSTTRFSVGQSIQIGVGSSQVPAFYYTVGSNESTVFCSFAGIYNAAFSGTTSVFCLSVWDTTSTIQCTVSWKSNGDIEVYRGDRGGTLLQTFSSAYSAQVWTHYQVKFVINNTTGSLTIRVNGSGSDTYSATGLNNRASANNYCNVVGCTQPAGGNFIIDDMWWFSSSGGSPNTWIGDNRATQVVPSADTAQKDFTVNAATVNLGTTTVSIGNQQTFPANTIRTLQLITQTVPGTIGSCVVTFHAGATGNVKVGIYDSDGPGGVPGTLLATSNAVTNPVLGNNTFTFGSPYTPTINHNYWYAIITDVSVSIEAINGTNVNNYEQSRTYGSGFTNPMTTSLNSYKYATMYVVTTMPANNYAYVQELKGDGTTSYVQSTTSGAYDLYTTSGLTYTPSSVLGVSVRGQVAKSGAGSRTGQFKLKSGATTVSSSSFTVSTSFVYQGFIQDTDPNTAVAWTTSGVNAASFGPYISG